MKKITLNTLNLLFLFCFALVFTNCKKDNNTTPEKTLKENTVLHLDFDGNTLDQSIYKNHGESCGVHYKEDRRGNPNAAIYFDGNDYVEVPHFSKINFGLDDDFALSFWIKYSNQLALYHEANDVITKWMTNKGTEGKGYPFVVRVSNQTHEKYPFSITGARHGGTCEKSTSAGQLESAGDSKFHHVVFMKKGAMISFYLDGNLTAEILQDIACDTKNEAPLMLGSPRSDHALDRSWFKGYLDDLLILDRALEEEEIKYLFEN